MSICAVDNFWGQLNIAAPMSYRLRPATILKKSNLNHGACLKDILMKSDITYLLHKHSETSMPYFRGNIKFLLVHWSLEVYGNSLCRHPAPVCPAMDEIRYNSTGNPWQNDKKQYKKYLKRKQNCLKVCSYTAIDHHNWALSMMHRCALRWYTTIKNTSYFFMTLSCTEAIQSIISHFNP